MALKNLTVVELREKQNILMNKDALIAALSRKKVGGGLGDDEVTRNSSCNNKSTRASKTRCYSSKTSTK
jgi:hypothetical protein